MQQLNNLMTQWFAERSKVLDNNDDKKQNSYKKTEILGNKD